jgi:hypothetical protein
LKPWVLLSVNTCFDFFHALWVKQKKMDDVLKNKMLVEMGIPLLKTPPSTTTYHGGKNRVHNMTFNYTFQKKVEQVY